MEKVGVNVVALLEHISQLKALSTALPSVEEHRTMQVGSVIHVHANTYTKHHTLTHTLSHSLSLSLSLSLSSVCACL